MTLLITHLLAGAGGFAFGSWAGSHTSWGARVGGAVGAGAVAVVAWAAATLGGQP